MTRARQRACVDFPGSPGRTQASFSGVCFSAVFFFFFLFGDATGSCEQRNQHLGVHTIAHTHSHRFEDFSSCAHLFFCCFSGNPTPLVRHRGPALSGHFRFFLLAAKLSRSSRRTWNDTRASMPEDLPRGTRLVDTSRKHTDQIQPLRDRPYRVPSGRVVERTRPELATASIGLFI